MGTPLLASFADSIFSGGGCRRNKQDKGRSHLSPNLELFIHRRRKARFLSQTFQKFNETFSSTAIASFWSISKFQKKYRGSLSLTISFSFPTFFSFQGPWGKTFAETRDSEMPFANFHVQMNLKERLPNFGRRLASKVSC